MKALILDAEKKTAAVQEIDVPQPAVGELLVKVEAVALNPVDALYTVQPLGETGRTVGTDFCGTVVEVGGRAGRAGAIAKGQRVAGFLQGACSANERPGAFAEYLVVPADLVWLVPGALSAEQAAAVSLTALTAAQAIFFRLQLKSPFSWDNGDEGVLRRVASEQEEEGAGGREAADKAAKAPLSFFIYGASTSVGLYAAQLVRRSAEAAGRTVKLFGAASKARFPLLQAQPYGYDGLVDYRDPDWSEQVRKLSGGGVDFAYDTISEGPSVKLTAGTLKDAGKGGVAIVRSRAAGAWQGDDLPLEPIYGAVWEGLGVDVQYHKFTVHTSPAKRAFAAAFYKWLSDGGQLEPNPVRLMPGGLGRIVPDGFALLGSGVSDRQHDGAEPHMKPISGEKLVYKVERS